MLNDLNMHTYLLSRHQNTAVSAASSAVTTALSPLLHYHPGHKSRDHRGHFQSQSRVVVDPETDKVVQKHLKQVRSTMRQNNSTCMALVLLLQKYKPYFVFDQDIFQQNLILSKEKSKTNRTRRRPQKEGEKEEARETAKETGKKEKQQQQQQEHGMALFVLSLKSDFDRIDQCQASIDDMKMNLVDVLDLHLYRISLRSFKSNTIGNAKMCHALLLRDVQQQAMKIVNAMNDKFGQYYDTISKWPKTVEEFDHQMHAVSVVCGGR
jgi:type III secretory pathway component EscV